MPDLGRVGRTAWWMTTEKEGPSQSFEKFFPQKPDLFFSSKVEKLNGDLDVTKFLASLVLAGCWMG